MMTAHTFRVHSDRVISDINFSSIVQYIGWIEIWNVVRVLSVNKAKIKKKNKVSKCVRAVPDRIYCFVFVL